MLILKLFGVTLICGVVLCDPLNDINIKLVNGDDEFVDNIHDKLNIFKRAIYDIDQGATINYVGQIAGKTADFLKYFLKKSMEKKYKIAKNETYAIKLEMQRFHQFFNDMKANQNGKDAVLYEMHDLIVNRVNSYNYFDIFLDYPHVAMPSIFSLVPVVIGFNRIGARLGSRLAENNLPCKLKDILLMYQHLVTVNRLSGLVVHKGSDCTSGSFFSPNNASGNVLSRPYSEAGYIEKEHANECDCVECDLSDDEFVRPKKFWCLRDIEMQTTFHSYTESSAEDCAMGYAEVIRTRIEEAFRLPIEITGEEYHGLRKPFVERQQVNAFYRNPPCLMKII